jgi:Domain of unknown function (DUF1931)
MMPVMAVHRFERFFRAAAGLDVDKEDLKRYSDFVLDKTYDMLVIAKANAKANGRDVIEPVDLPVTKGLQECVHGFSKLDEEVELRPIMEHMAAVPPLDVSLSEEALDRLPDVVGGLSVALARIFKILDPDVKNPQTSHWERSFRVFDLVL